MKYISGMDLAFEMTLRGGNRPAYPLPWPTAGKAHSKEATHQGSGSLRTRVSIGCLETILEVAVLYPLSLQYVLDTFAPLRRVHPLAI